MGFPLGRVPGGVALLSFSLPEVGTICNSSWKMLITSHSKGGEKKTNSKERAVKKLLGGVIASCILEERDVFRDKNCLTKVN